MIGLTKIDARHERFGALIQALDMAEREFKTTFEPRPPGPKKALFTAYRKVRPAVEFETQGKCAYCESYVKDTYVGDVEHILPKDGDPKNRTLRYSNLTFVCWLCNNHKSNCEFDDGFGLLNPYDVDPQSYLRFFGTMLRSVPNENRLRGQRTIDKIGLNRPGLLEQRNKHTEACALLELSYHNAAQAAVRDFAMQTILETLESNQEYSFLSRAYFASTGLVR